MMMMMMMMMIYIYIYIYIYQISPGPKTTIMGWACDAKGRDPYNKKHVEHDSDGNPTQRTSKDEMA